MELKHTHRTHQIRSDYELAALHLMIIWNGCEPNPDTIEDTEAKFRGHQKFERCLRRAADWLQKFNQDFKAKAHECGGQLCDQGRG